VLERLLSTLAEGGIHTPADLANQLDVSERLVEHMLADLSRMGYLRSVSSGPCQALPSGDHTGPCAGCPLSNGCAVCEPGSRVWALTQKAFR
jgi:hypothetical protein